ncbi:MAG: nickel pincer cofactor biosynthesis protein LarB [Thermodesulfobacteriota bacterium]
MHQNKLEEILAAVSEKRLSVEDARKSLANLFSEDVGFAHVDHHRSLRKGFPEVIFGESKSAEVIVAIMERMLAQEDVVLVTRVSPDKAQTVRARFPEAVYDADCGALTVEKKPLPDQGRGEIAVVCAGTSDISVAKEAAVTARIMGNSVATVFDVGVAGLHRLFAHDAVIARATVIVVAAGMEGALPSVVAGMYPKPVIAVPTSVGYGASFGGLAALLGMLNSCASNVAVVNIDNGFGAGYMAAMINRKQ